MEISERSIFNLIIFPSIILLHFSNNVLILRNKSLHKTIYYLLVNLSVSDIMLCVTVFLTNLNLHHNIYLEISYATCYTASVISTVAITVDRYVAVVHCLHYRDIATKRRMLVAIVLIWTLSLLLSVLPSIITQDHAYRLFVRDCIHCPVYLMCSVFLVCSSLLIQYVRNKHVVAIKKRKVYFGIEDERLGILQNLKLAVMEVIRLNFVTALLVFVGNILDVVDKYYWKGANVPLFVATIVFKASYMMSNPIVYILTMTELKVQYRKIFSC